MTNPLHRTGRTSDGQLVVGGLFAAHDTIAPRLTMTLGAAS